MKPHLTLDFLRGLLAAYAARECYMYSLISPSLVQKHADMLPLAVFISVAVIGLHLFVLVALLTRRAPRAVFVCLLLSAVMPFLSLSIQRFDFLVSVGTYRTIRSVAFFVVHIAAGVVAYVYYRGFCHAQRPNQSLEPTAGRREVQI